MYNLSCNYQQIVKSVKCIKISIVCLHVASRKQSNRLSTSCDGMLEQEIYILYLKSWIGILFFYSPEWILKEWPLTKWKFGIKNNWLFSSNCQLGRVILKWYFLSARKMISRMNKNSLCSTAVISIIYKLWSFFIRLFWCLNKNDVCLPSVYLSSPRK